MAKVCARTAQSHSRTRRGITFGVVHYYSVVILVSGNGSQDGMYTVVA